MIEIAAAKSKILNETHTLLITVLTALLECVLLKYLKGWVSKWTCTCLPLVIRVQNNPLECSKLATMTSCLTG